MFCTMAWFFFSIKVFNDHSKPSYQWTKDPNEHKKSPSLHQLPACSITCQESPSGYNSVHQSGVGHISLQQSPKVSKSLQQSQTVKKEISKCLQQPPTVSKVSNCLKKKVPNSLHQSLTVVNSLQKSPTLYNSLQMSSTVSQSL